MARTRRSRWLLGGLVATTGVVGPVATAAAQVADPAPDSSMPGGTLLMQMIAWTKYAAIASAVLGLLIGAVSTAVGHFGSNYGASSAGRKWILGGVGAAMLAGLAHTIAMTVYNAT